MLVMGPFALHVHYFLARDRPGPDGDRHNNSPGNPSRKRRHGNSTRNPSPEAGLFQRILEIRLVLSAVIHPEAALRVPPHAHCIIRDRNARLKIFRVCTLKNITSPAVRAYSNRLIAIVYSNMLFQVNRNRKRILRIGTSTRIMRSPGEIKLRGLKTCLSALNWEKKPVGKKELRHPT